MVTIDFTAMDAVARSGSLSVGTPDSARKRDMEATSSSVSPYRASSMTASAGCSPIHAPDASRTRPARP